MLSSIRIYLPWSAELSNRCDRSNFSRHPHISYWQTFLPALAPVLVRGFLLSSESAWIIILLLVPYVTSSVGAGAQNKPFISNNNYITNNTRETLTRVYLYLLIIYYLLRHRDVRHTSQMEQAKCWWKVGNEATLRRSLTRSKFIIRNGD